MVTAVVTGWLGLSALRLHGSLWPLSNKQQYRGCTGVKQATSKSLPVARPWGSSLMTTLVVIMAMCASAVDPATFMTPTMHLEGPGWFLNQLSVKLLCSPLLSSHFPVKPTHSPHTTTDALCNKRHWHHHDACAGTHSSDRKQHTMQGLQANLMSIMTLE